MPSLLNKIFKTGDGVDIGRSTDPIDILHSIRRQLHRLADSHERIAASLERAYPPPPTKEKVEEAKVESGGEFGAVLYNDDYTTAVYHALLSRGIITPRMSEEDQMTTLRRAMEDLEGKITP